MKRFNILLAFLLVITACKNREKSNTADSDTTETNEYASYGEAITTLDALDQKGALDSYQRLRDTDTVALKFEAKVLEVCQAKGCWMKLSLPNGEETMVRFKEYGFFVPKDISGSTVIVSGEAFLNELSIEEQQHYAEEGTGEIEPDSIIAPKQGYGFLAHGVLVGIE